MITYFCKKLGRVNSDESGQSIVFVTLILLTMVAFVGVTINVGNFVAAKIRMQNVVDAAALNGVIWEARGFNAIQAANAAIFAGEYVVATEWAEAAYWALRFALCGPCSFWTFWCCYYMVMAIIEAIDALIKQIDLGSVIADINDFQRDMATTVTPINVALSYGYELAFNPYNESSWYYILPGTYFFSGSVLFRHTPGAGNWYDLILGKLACNNTGGGLFYNRYMVTTADYPLHQWLFYFCYREKVEEPMLNSQFDAGGAGYFVIAQAAPYSKANSSWLSYKNIYEGDTWDARLVPINVDDMIWNQLFGWFPPLQWLFTTLTNMVILH